MNKPNFLWLMLICFIASFSLHAQDDVTPTNILTLINAESAGQLTELYTLPGHDDAVTDVAFNPDGQFIVTTSDDTTVHLWSASDGAPIGEYYEHGSYAKAVAFNRADPRQFATVGWDGVVLLWALTDDGGTGGAAVTDRIVGTTYEGVIENVSFTPEGEALAFSVGDGTIRIVTLPDGDEIHQFSVESLRVETAALAPVLVDDQLILAASGGFPETSVHIWTVEDDAEIALLEGHEADHNTQVTALAFDSAAGQLATGDAEGMVRVWQIENAPQIAFTERLVLPQDDWVSALAFSPDGELLVVGLEDGTIHFWDLTDGTDVAAMDTAAINARGGTVHAVAMNSAGTMLASAHDDGVVRVWGIR